MGYPWLYKVYRETPSVLRSTVPPCGTHKHFRYIPCIPSIAMDLYIILQSVQKEPFHQKLVMDHVRHVQLTVRGLGLV